jgi:hypothetical protein
MRSKTLRQGICPVSRVIGHVLLAEKGRPNLGKRTTMEKKKSKLFLFWMSRKKILSFPAKTCKTFKSNFAPSELQLNFFSLP